MFVTGLMSESTNVTLSAGLVVVLAPIGGWLTAGTPHTRESAAARRVDRYRSGRVSVTDVGWVLATAICVVDALGIPGFVLAIWLQQGRPDRQDTGSSTGFERVWEYIYPRAIPIFWILTSLLFVRLLLVGSWRRTRWGYRPLSPDATETETMPTRAPTPMSKARYISNMTVLAVLALLILGASVPFAILVDW